MKEDFAKKRFFLIGMVFLDLFAVGLVIPLFPRVIKLLGLDVHKIGYMTSAYNASQIIGGLVLGSLSDRIGRKTVLLINFFGAGVAYFLIGIATEWWHLLLSRLIVGLVKQTDTFSKALMVDLTSPENRAQWLGRISASVSLAFLLAQSIGGRLAVSYGLKKPILFACGLYSFNFIVFGLFFTEPIVSLSVRNSSSSSIDPRPNVRIFGRTIRNILKNMYMLLQEPGIRGWFFLFALTKVWRNGNYTLAWTYEMERFKLEPDSIGYFGSFKKALMVLANSYLITMLKSFGKEEFILQMLILVILGSTAVELTNLPVSVYLLQASVSMVAISTVNTLIMTQLLDRIPNRRRGACLGVLDVFSSGTGVLCPILIGFIPAASEMRSPYFTFGCYALMAVSLLLITRGDETLGKPRKTQIGLGEEPKKSL